MSTHLDVLFFPAGAASAGIPATARLDAAGLTVDGAESRRHVPAVRLSLRAGGYDGGQWLLEWSEAAGRAAIQLPSGDAARAFLAAGPATLRAAAQAVGRRQARRGRLTLALLAVFLALPLFALAIFWLNADRLAGWATQAIGLEQEQALGDLAFAQMRPTLKLRQSGAALEMLRVTGARLTAGSRYGYRWFVADSPEVNAFAMPGGYVVVYTGLLKAASGADEVAGVLAHEVQHVELRHALKGMLHGLGWRALLAVALGDWSGGAWAGMAQQLGALGYGRDLERQADQEGLKALRRAGIAPQGMLTFFARLAAQERGAPAWLSSHPSSAERLDSLRQAIADQGPAGGAPVAVDWARVRADL